MKSMRTLSFVALIAAGIVNPAFTEQANGQGMMEYGGMMGAMPKIDGNKATGATNKLYNSADISKYVGRAKSRADAAGGAGNRGRGGGAGNVQNFRSDGIVPHPSGTPRPTGAARNTKNPKDKNTALPTVSRELMAKESAKASELYKKATDAQEAGKLDDALTAFKGSMTIRDYFWKGQDPAVPVILTNMAKIYMQQEKPDDAISSSERALGYYGVLYGPGSDHRIQPLTILGAAYLKKGNKSKAVDNYEQALALSAKAKGSSDSIKLALEIAEANRQAENLSIAADAYKLAFKSEHDAETALGANKLTTALGEYKEVLVKLNRPSDAQVIDATLQRRQSGGGDENAKAPEPAGDKKE